MSENNDLPKNAFASAADQERSKSQDFISQYVNNVTIGMSNWDVNFIFGRMRSNNAIEETSEIVMSKELAKIFAILIGRHIQAYEQQFGVIQIPDLSQFHPITGNPVIEETEEAAPAKNNEIPTVSKSKKTKPKRVGR